MQTLEEHQDQLERIRDYVRKEAVYINSLAFQNVNPELRGYLVGEFERLKKDFEFYELQCDRAARSGKKKFDRDKYLVRGK